MSSSIFVVSGICAIYLTFLNGIPQRNTKSREISPNIVIMESKISKDGILCGIMEYSPTKKSISRKLAKSPFSSLIRSALPSDVRGGCRVRHTSLTCLTIENRPSERFPHPLSLHLGFIGLLVSLGDSLVIYRSADPWLQVAEAEHFFFRYNPEPVRERSF